MALKKAVLPPDPCPYCTDLGIDEPLLFIPESKPFHFCKRGHEYQDREMLDTLLRAAIAKRRQMTPQPATPPPVSEPPQIQEDQTLVQSGTGGVVQGQANGIAINPIDYVRLAQKVGDFTDSSSLYGCVFALWQQLQDTNELLERAKANDKLGLTGGIRKLGGDIEFKCLIPEEFAEPIKDIAEANGMTIDRYMNARIHDGLVNFWFT